MQFSLAGSAAREAIRVHASCSAAAAETASLLAVPSTSSMTSASRECRRPQPSTTPLSWYALHTSIEPLGLGFCITMTTCPCCHAVMAQQLVCSYIWHAVPAQFWPHNSCSMKVHRCILHGILHAHAYAFPSSVPVMKQIQHHASQKRVKISAKDPMISTHLSLHTRSGEGSQRAGLTKKILKRLYNS